MRIPLCFAALGLLSACAADRLIGPNPEAPELETQLLTGKSRIANIANLETSADLASIEVIKGGSAVAIYGTHTCSAIWVIVTPRKSTGGELR